MDKFKKKTVVIEAVQFTGENAAEIIERMRGSASSVYYVSEKNLAISTHEVSVLVNKGDWVIKGENGEFYPCKTDIFEEKYDPA